MHQHTQGHSLFILDIFSAYRAKYSKLYSIINKLNQLLMMYKKNYVLILLCFFLFTKAKGQITKGNWLVGGNANFSSIKSQTQSMSSTSNVINLKVSPNIGKFLFDKLAVGIKANVEHTDASFNLSETKQTFYAFGPFVRYYFLSSDNQVNIFSEPSYQHFIFNPGTGLANNYSLILGSVIFFNSSVGIEFTTGYSITKNKKSDLTYKTLQLGLGFQIHLEKNN